MNAGAGDARPEGKRGTRWSQVKELLKERNVSLLSAGMDEARSSYKDVEAVMAPQRDLVRPLAKFVPRIVRMAPKGERPED